MHTKDSSIVITGTNRGLGRALVDEALRAASGGESVWHPRHGPGVFALAEGWRHGLGKGLERQFASFVGGQS